MAAPASSNTSTTPSLPPPLAIIRGVHPSIVLGFWVADREHPKRMHGVGVNVDDTRLRVKAATPPRDVSNISNGSAGKQLVYAEF